MPTCSERPDRYNISVAVDPEIEFDRVFQAQHPYRPPVVPGDPDPRPYKGKHDLSGLHPTIREQLLLFQKSFNEELRNEKKNVPEHVSHPPFHFDYVDSTIENALAIRTEDYSFIAITLPLVFALSDVCRLLSRSVKVCLLLGVQPSEEEYSPLHAALFYAVLNFVVSHEYAHHVFGHVDLSDAGSSFPDEIAGGGDTGDLDGQVREVVADGYSINLVLANLLDGSGRSWAATVGLDGKPADSGRRRKGFRGEREKGSGVKTNTIPG
jgi:hypothetical protein